jgi:site-specific DNA-cytosine methylase
MRSKPEVLAISSYGGSLVIAAHREGFPVIGSYEEHGYGHPTQKLNFPDLDYRSQLADWPLDLDLRGKIVIAHPPCSGFSSQNRSKSPLVRGIASNAFACTKRLLDYVCPRGPEAIAIESVPAAMEGGRPVHDFYAKIHGYDIYRILQNACSFGVPQWRRRFWIVLVKQNAGHKKTFTVRATHNIVRVKDVLDPDVPTPDNTAYPQGHEKRWAEQIKLAGKIPLPEAELRQILENNHGSILHILSNYYKVPTGWTARRPYAHQYVCGGRFLSGSLHSLDPEGFAHVLLATAWWWYGRRMLSLADYKVLMGFPADYLFEKDRVTLELLSRGVVPQVAQWILRLIDHNIFGASLAEGENYHFHQELVPGECADVRPPNLLKEKTMEEIMDEVAA